MQPTEPSITALLTNTAFTAAATATPAVSGVGFGDDQNPGPLLLWYALGGLAFLAMLLRNVAGFVRDIRGSGAAEKKDVSGHVSSTDHNDDIAAVYDRLEKIRGEIDQKISQQTNTLSRMASDIAAARTAHEITSRSMKQMLAIITRKETEA